MLSLGLPLVAAALLVVSGLVKLRASGRAHLGTHAPSVLELVLGGGLVLLAAGGGMGPGAGLAVSVAAGMLVVASSVHLGRGLAAQRALRDRTEGYRLAAYLRRMPSPEDG